MAKRVKQLQTKLKKLNFFKIISLKNGGPIELKWKKENRSYWPTTIIKIQFLEMFIYLSTNTNKNMILTNIDSKSILKLSILIFRLHY